MAKTTAMVLGWIFLVLGVLGFIPNPLVGEGALFHTDALVNIVHLVLGVILLWVVYKAVAKVGTVSWVLGVILVILAVLGFVSDSGMVLGLLEVNGAHNWLHLVLGLLLVWAGLSARKAAPAPMGGQTGGPMGGQM